MGAGEFGPIITAAADNFFALAVVGFMKLSEALAVDLTLFEVDPVEAVEDKGRIGLERAARGLLLLDVMFGVEVADILKREMPKLVRFFNIRVKIAWVRFTNVKTAILAFSLNFTNQNVETESHIFHV